MTSGNTVTEPPHIPETTSGNTAARRGRVPVVLTGDHDQALAAYTAALISAPIAESSKAKYASRVRSYLAWLAETDVDGNPLADPAARDGAVRDYRTWLKTVAKAKATTINNTLAAVDDFYTRRGLGPAKAAREDVRRTAPRALDEKDSRRWLRALERCESARDRAIGALPYYAGLRISEVVGLDVDDIQLSARKGSLRILGKGRDGGKLRQVPVHAKLRTALRAWLDERAKLMNLTEMDDPETNPALFPGRHGKGRLTDRAARDVITNLGEDLADEDFGPHTLRHTFATQLVRAGIDLVVVAELLGHARLDTTRRYSLPTDADRAAALDKLLVDH